MASVDPETIPVFYTGDDDDEGLRVQHPAPAFEAEAVMPDGDFKTVKLSDYEGKWVSHFFV